MSYLLLIAVTCTLASSAEKIETFQELFEQTPAQAGAGALVLHKKNPMVFLTQDFSDSLLTHTMDHLFAHVEKHQERFDITLGNIMLRALLPTVILPPEKSQKMHTFKDDVRPGNSSTLFIEPNPTLYDSGQDLPKMAVFYDDILGNGRTNVGTILPLLRKSPDMVISIFFGMEKQGKADPVNDVFTGGKFVAIPNPKDRIFQRLVEELLREVDVERDIRDLDSLPPSVKAQVLKAQKEATQMIKQCYFYTNSGMTHKAFQRIAKDPSPWIVQYFESFSPFVERIEANALRTHLQKLTTLNEDTLEVIIPPSNSGPSALLNALTTVETLNNALSLQNISYIKYERTESDGFRVSSPKLPGDSQSKVALISEEAAKNSELLRELQDAYARVITIPTSHMPVEKKFFRPLPKEASEFHSLTMGEMTLITSDHAERNGSLVTQKK